MQQPLLTDTELFDLAPLHLVNERIRRYRGDGVSVSLNAFSPIDVDRIRRMYDVLLELRTLLDSPIETINITDVVTSFTRRHDWLSLINNIREISDPGSDRAAGQVVHDLRGGAFQALSVFIQLAEMGISQPEDWARMFLLTRDHLKIIRNCIPDLDPERYAQDMLDRAHNVSLLVEKWNSSYALPGLEVNVQLDCRFDGIVSERCIEFSALDRVLYNLMNNATRNAADRQVQLSIVPLPSDGPPNLRIAITNRVTPEQEQRLISRFGTVLKQLFYGGFTTGGTGLGLQICADFVTNAYGLTSPAVALENGYLGATCADHRFIAFFHWPTVAD
ncbi:MAG TPA: ATP-binding protein [Roseiflexaceae bacterium]|nr:ATP-binding protein [Roseiflexaceae bacterium]HMP42921.1 ATP-binding protein [Roseiflexaceae bacterium]